MARRQDIRQVAAGPYWCEADARVMVAAWQDSGKTLTAFARQHGVDPRRMARWRTRLRQAAPAAVRFHPVQVAAQSGVLQEGSPIEIELGGGRRVRVGPGFDIDDLRRVMTVLEETRC